MEGRGREGKEGEGGVQGTNVDISQVNNLKAPHGKCNDSVELDFYAAYTMSTCYMDCKQRYVISRCLCRDVYMASDPYQGDSSRDYKTTPKTIRLFELNRHSCIRKSSMSITGRQTFTQL